MTMDHCRYDKEIQWYLDDELDAPARAAFEAHLDDCETCPAELERLALAFALVERIPVTDPGPSLTERILDRVLPSRLRRRWVTAIGWSYTAVSAVCTFALVSWIARPTTPAWVADRVADSYIRLLQTGLFALGALNATWVRLAEGAGLMSMLVEAFAPVLRALSLPFMQPAIGVTIWAAAMVTAVAIWWMRPRARTAMEDIRHVDLLGF